jgi:hypothetical protein
MLIFVDGSRDDGFATTDRHVPLGRSDHGYHEE